MSLHHVRLVHGSPPNPSDDRRIGFAIRYIPTTVAQLAGEDSATLVRGEDRHHHFVPEPEPSRDLDPSGRETPSNAGAVAIRHDQRASYGFFPLRSIIRIGVPGKSNSCRSALIR